MGAAVMGVDGREENSAASRSAGGGGEYVGSNACRKKIIMQFESVVDDAREEESMVGRT